MQLQILIPIATLILGFLLSEYAQHLRVRQRNIESINRALTELLEIRFQLLGKKQVLLMMKNKFAVSHTQLLELFISFGMLQIPFLHFSEDIKSRYNDAINTLSSTNPFLAFRLRSRDLLPLLFEKIETGSVDLKKDAPSEILVLIEKLSEQISDELITGFDDIIIEMSKQSGIRTYFKVIRHMKNSRSNNDVEKEFNSFFDSIFKDKGLTSQSPNENISGQAI
jgi:hypothetical protein